MGYRMEGSLADKDLAQARTVVAFKIDESGMALVAQRLRLRRKVGSDEDRGRMAVKMSGALPQFPERIAKIARICAGLHFAGQSMAVTVNIDVRLNDFRGASAAPRFMLHLLQLDGRNLSQ